MSEVVTNLADLLRGCTAGRAQTVGVMQVIPLISEVNDERFAPPQNLRVSNRNYGHVRLRNATDRPVIMPRDSAFMTKRAAQNHALSKAAIILANSARDFETGACIQQTQGGTLRESDTELSLLPFPLREAAFEVSDVREYGKLWNAISAFNQRMGARSGGHVEHFLIAFKKQLDEFVSEFEPVPQQVGAIILVNGKIAGIERFSSYEQWLSVWPLIIRDCYGALALYVQRSSSTPPDTRISLGEADTLDALADALAEVEAEEQEAVKQVVRDLVAEPISENEDSPQAGFQMTTLKNAQFLGQVVRDGATIVYASLIATATRLAAKGKQQPFSI